MSTIKIELTPYNACALKNFLREFINKKTETHKSLTAISKAVDQFEKEILDKITPEQIDEALHESNVNELLGYEPKGLSNE